MVLRLSLLVALAVWPMVSPAAASEASTPPAQDAASHLKAREFFAVNLAGRPVAVDREFMGVVIQDVRLIPLGSRGESRQYRVIVCVRNMGRAVACPSFRLVIWSGESPVVAFDIHGEEKGVLLAPKTSTRFVGTFSVAKGTQLSRFSVVPLPPFRLVVRAREPVPVPPAEGASSAAPDSEKTEELSPEEARRREELARFEEAARQMYEAQARIQDTLGRFAGIGPFGATYVTPGGGLFVASPEGWVPVDSIPGTVTPQPLRVFP